MDHAVTARLQFGAQISRANEPSNTSISSLAVFREFTDEALFEGIAGGAQDALVVLFRRYARQIRGVGLRILRDGGEADDLVQEVFLYVFRKSTLYDPTKGPARSWLIQVAYTQAFVRRRELNSHGFYATVAKERPSENDLFNPGGAYFDLTVEGFFGRNGWSNVWDSLTQSQRETLRLHFYEGCTFAEIAERLGQSYVNIRHHYYRALDRLRKHANENNLKWP